MENKLTEEEINWIKKAVEKGYTKEEFILILNESDNTKSRVDEFVEGYDEINRHIADGEVGLKFKEQVENYQKGEMGWWEGRKIKRWLKDLKKLAKFLEGLAKKTKELQHKIKDEKSAEIQNTRRINIEAILSSRDILEFKHPQTDEEINEINIQSCSTEELIDLMESGAKDLKDVAEGKK